MEIKSADDLKELLDYDCSIEDWSVEVDETEKGFYVCFTLTSPKYVFDFEASDCASVIECVADEFDSFEPNEYASGLVPTDGKHYDIDSILSDSYEIDAALETLVYIVRSALCDYIEER